MKKSKNNERKAVMAACEAAEHANRIKTEFLSQMNHDIRTPMNAIIGMTNIASANINNPERVQDCLNKISVSGRHLVDFMNEVLDMSKIECGQLEMSEEPFELREFIEGTIDIIKPDINVKNHKFTLTIHNLLHSEVIGDYMRLQEIISNIISNSIEYTPEGGELSLEVLELDSTLDNVGRYQLIFKDNGIGMSDEYLKHIFEPFSREIDTRMNKVHGTGLGMCIANNLVRMMSGDISVSSRKGEGTCFKVSIYLKLQDCDSHLFQNSRDINLDEIDFSNYRVLIVEDNELNREIAEELIGFTKVHIDTAENGMDAINKIQSSTEFYYDMIFMDIQMPVMDGYSATVAIRSLERDDVGAMPIVAMTANAFAEDIIRSKRMGMNDHISKPIDLPVIVKAMNRWIKDRRLDTQLTRV